MQDVLIYSSPRFPYYCYCNGASVTVSQYWCITEIWGIFLLHWYLVSMFFLFHGPIWLCLYPVFLVFYCLWQFLIFPFMRMTRPDEENWLFVDMFTFLPPWNFPMIRPRTNINVSVVSCYCSKEIYLCLLKCTYTRVYKHIAFKLLQLSFDCTS